MFDLDRDEGDSGAADALIWTDKESVLVHFQDSYEIRTGVGVAGITQQALTWGE